MIAAIVAAALAAAPLEVAVDARDVTRSILHTRVTMPAHPGPLTLVYPKWIAGEHMPSGPIANLAGLVVRADGTTIPWRRDEVDGYAFHVDVPPNARRVEATFDFLLGRGGSFSAGASATPQLAVLSWNQLVLVPSPYRSRDVRVHPSVVLPAGWNYATALRGGHNDGGRLVFDPVSLETLVDSPLATGVHVRKITLWDRGAAGHAELDAVADSDEALALSDATVSSLRNLVAEELALFGARHWHDYHFLLTLSDNVTSFGLEHHESSDDRLAERAYTDPVRLPSSAGLLPHEFTHSWNGKYRRPAGLATPDMQAPMRDELLWVYEGLTQYYGDVLSFRDGGRSASEWPAYVANVYGDMQARSGRRTRALADTAIFATNLYVAPGYGVFQRRGVDFYPEGELLWLDVDTTIRTRTNGARSLDDFARRFFGGTDTLPAVVPYTRADVIAALNAVAPHDWERFIHDRLDVPTALPPDGFSRAGWRMAYSDRPSVWVHRRETADKIVDLRWSLGLVAREDGTIVDVVGDWPAARAGLAPEQTLIAIGGRTFSRESADDALRAAARSQRPIEVVVDDLGAVTTRTLSYTGGPRYPQLVRTSGPDLLARIVAPKRAAGRR